MSSIRSAYLAAATVTVQLLDRPEIALRWAGSSALAEFSIAGLAGHLANQVFNVDRVLEATVPAGMALTPVSAHYAAATWIGASLADEVNVTVRTGGEAVAAIGAMPLARRAAEAVDLQRDVLRVESADRVVLVPWAGRAMLLDDFLVTRMLEMTVHADDLAVSVGMATPRFPAEVIDPVIGILAALSMRRHGQVALLRALSRAERAPTSVAAM